VTSKAGLLHIGNGSGRMHFPGLRPRQPPGPVCLELRGLRPGHRTPKPSTLWLPAPTRSCLYCGPRGLPLRARFVPQQRDGPLPMCRGPPESTRWRTSYDYRVALDMMKTAGLTLRAADSTPSPALHEQSRRHLPRRSMLAAWLSSAMDSNAGMALPLGLRSHGHLDFSPLHYQ